MRRGWRLGVGWLALACALSPGAVRADELPRARLALETPEDATVCPDAQTLRDLVAGRLGRDPFDEEAHVRVRVEVQRSSAGLDAHIELSTADGEGLGTRRLSAPVGECDELLAAASVAVALALDPASGIVPPAPDRPASAPEREPPDAAAAVPQARDAETPPLLETEPDPPSPAAPERPRVSVGLGPSAVYGHMPEIAPGATVAARIRRRRFVFALEGSAHFSPGPMQVNETSVRMTDLAIAALPCLRVRFVSACGVVTAALVEARRTRGDRSPARTVVPRLGIRVGATWRTSAAIGLSAWLQGDASIVQPVLRTGEERGWTAPPVALAFGLSLELYP